jgi:hypothetical protein
MKSGESKLLFRGKAQTNERIKESGMKAERIIMPDFFRILMSRKTIPIMQFHFKFAQKS